MTESPPHVDSIVGAVMLRSGNRWDRSQVFSLARDYVKEFDGAPIQDFIEVLVTNHVMAELRRVDALRQLAS